jgi:hypothetical protein
MDLIMAIISCLIASAIMAFLIIVQAFIIGYAWYQLKWIFKKDKK